MTREEAIETLQANYPDACFELLREAVDTAISALRTDGDTISRQAAIDALCKMRCGCVLSDCPLNYEEDGAEECADVRWLMGLPSAQPERKRGYWIEHEWAEEVEGYLISNYECSCCHTWERKNSDYCPECGADLRGGNNGKST